MRRPTDNIRFVKANGPRNGVVETDAENSPITHTHTHTYTHTHARTHVCITADILQIMPLNLAKEMRLATCHSDVINWNRHKEAISETKRSLAVNARCHDNNTCCGSVTTSQLHYICTKILLCTRWGNSSGLIHYRYMILSQLCYACRRLKDAWNVEDLTISSG